MREDLGQIVGRKKKQEKENEKRIGFCGFGWRVDMRWNHYSNLSHSCYSFIRIKALHIMSSNFLIKFVFILLSFWYVNKKLFFLKCKRRESSVDWTRNFFFYAWKDPTFRMPCQHALFYVVDHLKLCKHS